MDTSRWGPGKWITGVLFGLSIVALLFAIYLGQPASGILPLLFWGVVFFVWPVRKD